MVIDAIRWIDYVHCSQTTTEDVLRALGPRLLRQGRRLARPATRRAARDLRAGGDGDRLPRHRHPLVDRDPRALRRMIDAVVSHHMNPFRSGVARFNELLAEHLGVPFVVAGRRRRAALRRCCRSRSPSSATARPKRLGARLARCEAPELFLHELVRLTRSSAGCSTRRARVLCGNHEIGERLRGRRTRASEVLWTPGLIVEERRHRSRRGPGVHLRHGAQDPHRPRSGACATCWRPPGARTRSASRPPTTRPPRCATPSSSSRRCTRSSRERLYFLGNLSDLAIVQELRARDVLRRLLRGRRAREQHVGRLGDGARRRRHHQPRRVLAAGVHATWTT